MVQITPLHEAEAFLYDKNQFAIKRVTNFLSKKHPNSSFFYKFAFYYIYNNV